MAGVLEALECRPVQKPRRLLPRVQRDCYLIAEQPAPAPHLARPEGRAALTHMCSLTESRMDSISTDSCSAASSSSSTSSLLPSHVNLEWCDKFKLSNLLLPRKSGTGKRLQLLSTSETLLIRWATGSRWSSRRPGGSAPNRPASVFRSFKNNYFTEMCSGSEVGSYARFIDLCITQL